MTADPNDAKPAAADMALELDGDAEDKPAAPPAAPTIDVDAVAEAVIGKLMKAAEAQPAREPAPSPQPAADTTSYDEMVRVVNSGDRTHPLYDTYNVQLAILRKQGVEDEWAALGCGADHPARSLFRQNPGAYSGMPRYAFQAWRLNELEKTSAADRAKAEKAEKDRADGQRVRDSAPGMPSRSVGGSTRTGTEHMTHAEFDRRVANEPILDDKLDRGLIVFTD